MGFGNFKAVCDQADLPLCPLVGPYKGSNLFGPGLLPVCYARSISLANTMVFNIGNVFIQLGTMLIVAVIIFNSYTKYTAVGRREMLDVLYLFFFLTMWSLVVDAGVTPASSGSFPWFVAIQAGITSSFCMFLFFFGLLGFQFWEDGTKKSVWGIRLVTTLWGVCNFVIAILTFKGWTTAFSPRETIPLMAVLYLVNAVIIFFYTCESLYLTAIVLRDWWAFGAQALGLLFFVAGQIIMYVFGQIICQKVKHYVDGIFFATVCNCFAVLMIYKAWDIMTSEDLEFSVSHAENTWELKSVDDYPVDAESEYALSNYNHQVPYM